MQEAIMSEKTSVLILGAFPDKNIKSLGNKGLIKINKNTNLVEYQIDFFQKAYKKPQIIIVGAFDGKRLNKFIIEYNKNNKTNIKYIEHPLDKYVNVGYSLKHAMKYVLHNNLVICDLSVALSPSSLATVSKPKFSFILAHKNKKTRESIGFILDPNDKHIGHCFYGLPNDICDFIYLRTKDVKILNKVMKITQNIQKFFLFEILNACIDNGSKIEPIYMVKNKIALLNNTKDISSFRKSFNKYV